MAIIIVALMFTINRLQNPLLIKGAAYTLFPMLTMCLAFIVGFEFPVASRLSFTTVPETAGRLYGADLVGSSVGAVAVAAVLILLVGIIGVCLIIAAANIMTGMIVSLGKTN